MNRQILVVDDEESIRYTFGEFLGGAGYQIDTADDYEQAVARLETREYEVIFLDILLGRANGIDVLKVARQLNPNTPVIMVTGGPEVRTAAEAVRYGAFDYITKPVSHDDLLRHAQRATDYKSSLDQSHRYQKRLEAVFNGIREGIMVFDSSLTLIEINFAATEILGCCRDGVGKSLRELLNLSANPILEALVKLLEARVEGEIFRLEVTDTQGEPRLMGISLSPLTTSTGMENDLVLVIRDETTQAKDLVSAP